MKSCVVTANYACDPIQVWLYLTKPTLNGWRRDVSSYEESDDGLKAAEKNTDGSETQIVFTRKEKPRCLSCNFQKGKISGTFTALLLGGGDATSVECTLDVNGLGLFTKPEKLLNERLEMLRQTLGAEKVLGPLCEGAPAAAGGGENLPAIRNISGRGKARSLRPCGPPLPL